VHPAAHITPEELEILSPLIGALARMAMKELAQEEADACAGPRLEDGPTTLPEAPEG
jgi:hypothetical protein